MQFTTLIISLMGLTAINAAAVPKTLEARQVSGIIASITATISSLEATLQTATGDAVGTIQDSIDGLQDTLDSLLGAL